MMPLRLLRPLAVFDLETTGVRIGQDRIVQLAIVRLHPDGTRDNYERMVDPEMPIPPEATAVHGIRDEDVIGAPTFSQLATEVLAQLADCDLCGFNCLRFDVPFLAEEFYRSGHAWDTSALRIVDVMRLYKMLHPRSLGAAVRHYLGHEHAGAHNALADVEATAEVLLAQLRQHPQELPKELDLLAELSGDRQRTPDPAGKLRFDAQGRVAIGFGKHAGRAIEDLVHSDPGYLDWMFTKGDFPGSTLAVIKAAAQRANT
jgi:DNA polymerase III subunit epsilon